MGGRADLVLRSTTLRLKSRKRASMAARPSCRGRPSTRETMLAWIRVCSPVCWYSALRTT